jgi:hypothetical protein
MVGAIDHAAILGPTSVGSKNRFVLPPRPAALLEAIEPFEDGALSEPNIAAEPKVRNAAGPRLGQHPAFRNSELGGEFAGV